MIKYKYNSDLAIKTCKINDLETGDMFVLGSSTSSNYQIYIYVFACGSEAVCINTSTRQTCKLEYERKVYPIHATIEWGYETNDSAEEKS